MFYDGDLQSGIALALQETKSVACFITDEGAESVKWQEEYFTDDETLSILNDKAITLRLNSESQETSFLKAYFPVTAIPSFIIIHNGRLLLDLTAGIQQPEFKTAVIEAFNSHPKLTDSSASAQSRSSETPSRPADSQAHAQYAPSLGAASNEGTTPSAPNSPAETVIQNNSEDRTSPPENGNARNATVERLLAERRLKLEKQKGERDAAEKAEKRAQAEARKAAMTTGPTSAKAKQATYAQQQKQRKQEAQSERERIVRQIEHDRQERKEREERRKAVAKAETEPQAASNIDGNAGKTSADSMSKPFSRSQHCALQTRLFDGTTIRQNFSHKQTISAHVRPWVDEQISDSNTPYTFKQILTPLPNRTFSEIDEEQTLADLGLAPNATLVLVPVAGFTSAYPSRQGPITRGFSALYNLIAAMLGMILGMIWSSLGTSGRASSQQGRAEQGQPGATGTGAERSTPATTESKIRIRTLQDQREDKDKNEFYNGNQLNFEPRKDDDDEHKT